MADQTSAHEDPLIAALPPATDYVTYLTLLEYQLTAENLPTLTRILSEDDGTLAEEIGWDLLKLVLRILPQNPDEANRCLDIISRRGNPREVVVRVAEELEQLGDDANDAPSDDENETDDESELPTFAGEAPRVHLGELSLDGMPDAKERPPRTTPSALGDEAVSAQPSGSEIKAIKLQALLQMLGLLHPRIKTQYPSRFLATSLPAALGAYRNIPITATSTVAFLNMLEKLAGKNRPALPPRVGSTQTATASTHAQTDSQPTATVTLPDPEAKAEKDETGANAASPQEGIIITRLLQAVLLEVLDEFLSSLATQDSPSMSWTSRLRERLEPKRLIPNRKTEVQLFTDTPELSERDKILVQAGRLGSMLGINALEEVKKLGHEDDLDADTEDAEDQASEYPTTPNQIPLPANGVIFLYASESYLSSKESASPLSLPAIAHLIDHTAPLSANPIIPNPALLDSLLSLLYRKTFELKSSETSPSPDSTASSAKFLLLLSTLTQLFTITPWADLRDSLHYVATKLLHTYPEAATRLQVITQTMQGYTLSSNWDEVEEAPKPAPGIDEETGLTRSTSALQPHPIPLAPPQQLGILRAVGVDWLKEEFLTHLRDQTSGLLHGLNPSLLVEVDAESSLEKPPVVELLFPDDLTPLAPDGNAAPATGSLKEDGSDALSDFLLNIPFYISTLNLLYVLIPQITSGKLTALLPRAQSHAKSLEASLAYLNSILKEIVEQEGLQAEQGFVLESRADINALQDALERVSVITKSSSGCDS